MFMRRSMRVFDSRSRTVGARPPAPGAALCAPVLQKLTEEHHVVAELQRRIKTLLEEFIPGQGDPTELRDEFEALAARLGLHFDEEEQHLFMVLNGLGPAPALS